MLPQRPRREVEPHELISLIESTLTIGSYEMASKCLTLNHNNDKLLMYVWQNQNYLKYHDVNGEVVFDKAEMTVLTKMYNCFIELTYIADNARKIMIRHFGPKFMDQILIKGRDANGKTTIKAYEQTEFNMLSQAITNFNEVNRRYSCVQNMLKKLLARFREITQCNVFGIGVVDFHSKLMTINDRCTQEAINLILEFNDKPFF